MLNYTDIIKSAVEQSSSEKTRLSPEILKLDGMSSSKGRSLLNYLVFPGSKYLEIGVWKGCSFSCALYNNTPAIAYAIDNWAYWKDAESDRRSEGKAHFLNTVQTSAPYKDYILIDKDSFSVTADDLQHNKFNVYFYDGDHSYESHKNALVYYYPFLEDEFILLVDDYDWDNVSRGTQDGIKEMNIKVLYETICSSDSWNTPHGSFGGWWNGYYIAHCKK